MKDSKRKQAVAPKLYTIVAIVFGAGAVGMVLELVGARLLAPYFGNSLFVWTSIIGVMLGFMSLGYFLGGRYADRHLDSTNLFWILVAAGMSVSLIAFSEGWLLPSMSNSGNVRTFAVLSAVLMFALPSTLLGMVSPYCIRLRMHAVEDSGATVGTLYAISTLGSILGTFLAGFWLIAVLGTHDLILLISVTLALLGLLAVGKSILEWRRLAAIAVLVLLIVLGYAGVAQGAETIDTQYDRYTIRELPDPATGRPLIGLSRDQQSAESVSYKDTGEPYAFDYYGYFNMAEELAGGTDRLLMIGGGTFSYPRLFIAANPDAQVDAVEIDPALYTIGKKQFGYVDDPRVHLYFEDGRTFLNRAKGPYDAVIVDAFKSEATVPYQLTTRETWQHAYDVLDDNGVLVMNVVASPNDSRARFFNALFATIQDVFPYVEVFEVQAEGGSGLHNTMILASKNPKVDLAAQVAKVAPQYATHLIKGYEPPADTRILTDDYAPVDQYLLGF